MLFKILLSEWWLI